MDIDLRERGFFVNLIRGNGGKVLWPKENGQQKTHTPWKFNIAPENIPSQKESSLPTIIFQGRAVKLREGISC